MLSEDQRFSLLAKGQACCRLLRQFSFPAVVDELNLSPSLIAVFAAVVTLGIVLPAVLFAAAAIGAVSHDLSRKASWCFCATLAGTCFILAAVPETWVPPASVTSHNPLPGGRWVILSFDQVDPFRSGTSVTAPALSAGRPLDWSPWSGLAIYVDALALALIGGLALALAPQFQHVSGSPNGQGGPPGGQSRMALMLLPLGTLSLLSSSLWLWLVCSVWFAAGSVIVAAQGAQPSHRRPFLRLGTQILAGVFAAAAGMLVLAITYPPMLSDYVLAILPAQLDWTVLVERIPKLVRLNEIALRVWDESSGWFHLGLIVTACLLVPVVPMHRDWAAACGTASPECVPLIVGGLMPLGLGALLRWGLPLSVPVAEDLWPSAQLWLAISALVFSLLALAQTDFRKLASYLILAAMASSTAAIFTGDAAAMAATTLRLAAIVVATVLVMTELGHLDRQFHMTDLDAFGGWWQVDAWGTARLATGLVSLAGFPLLYPAASVWPHAAAMSTSGPIVLPLWMASTAISLWSAVWAIDRFSNGVLRVPLRPDQLKHSVTGIRSAPTWPVGAGAALLIFGGTLHAALVPCMATGFLARPPRPPATAEPPALRPVDSAQPLPASGKSDEQATSPGSEFSAIPRPRASDEPLLAPVPTQLQRPGE